MKRISATVALAALIAAVPGAASAQSALEGHWKNAKGSLVVKVAPCGTTWCGIVVDATEKAKAGARRGGTANLIGTRILTGVRPAGDDVYKGQAFDAKRNIHVPATIRVLGPSTLSVKGCVLGGLICKEQRWTRVS
ncbi:MAG TPA: DUF2147 domain-containing protein [Sphingomicrobium sp.]